MRAYYVLVVKVKNTHTPTNDHEHKQTTAQLQTNYWFTNPSNNYLLATRLSPETHTYTQRLLTITHTTSHWRNRWVGVVVNNHWAHLSKCEVGLRSELLGSSSAEWKFRIQTHKANFRPNDFDPVIFNPVFRTMRENGLPRVIYELPKILRELPES
jgi:hypothetical protein